MKTETTSSTFSAEELLNDLHLLVEEAEKIAGRAPGVDAADIAEALRERVEVAEERLAAVYAETRRNVSTGAKYVDRTIRDHPYQALAVTLGVGVLAGVMIGRRSK